MANSIQFLNSIPFLNIGKNMVSQIYCYHTSNKIWLGLFFWKWAWFLGVREVTCPYHKEDHRVVHLNVFRFRFLQLCAMLCPKWKQNTNNLTHGLFPRGVFVENDIGEVVSRASGKSRSTRSAAASLGSSDCLPECSKFRKKSFSSYFLKNYIGVYKCFFLSYHTSLVRPHCCCCCY